MSPPKVLSSNFLIFLGICVVSMALTPTNATNATTYHEVQTKMSLWLTWENYGSGNGPQDGVFDQPACEASCTSKPACRGYGFKQLSNNTIKECRLFTVLPCQQDPISDDMLEDYQFFFKVNQENVASDIPDGEYELFQHAEFVPQEAPGLTVVHVSSDRKYARNLDPWVQLLNTVDSCKEACDSSVKKMGFVCKSFSFLSYENNIYGVRDYTCALFASSIYDSASLLVGKTAGFVGPFDFYSYVSGIKKEFVLPKDHCETSWIR